MWAYRSALFLYHFTFLLSRFRRPHLAVVTNKQTTGRSKIQETARTASDPRYSKDGGGVSMLG